MKDERLEKIDWLLKAGVFYQEDLGFEFNDYNHQTDNSALLWLCSSRGSVHSKNDDKIVALTYSETQRDYVVVLYDEDGTKWFHLGEDLYDGIIEEIQEYRAKRG